MTVTKTYLYDPTLAYYLGLAADTKPASPAIGSLFFDQKRN